MSLFMFSSPLILSIESTQQSVKRHPSIIVMICALWCMGYKVFSLGTIESREREMAEHQVMIINGSLIHLCGPGIKSHDEARKKSGSAFNFNDKKEAMEWIIFILDTGSVHPNTLWQLL